MSDNRAVEKINQRLVDIANRLYNDYTGKNINQLSGYDPLVNLLIGACASEFKDVYQEIGISKKRILRHLSKLMMPEVLQGALPAYAILHATPDSPNALTDALTDSVGIVHNDKKVSFTPVGNYSLTQGNVKWLASAASLFTMDQPLDKKELIRSISEKYIANNEFWIGIEGVQYATEIKDLSFFFDWGSAELANQTEAILAPSEWYFNGVLLKTELGIKDQSKTTDNLPFEDASQMRRIEREAEAYFKHQFVRLSGNSEIVSLENASLPDELIQSFGKDQLEKIIKNRVLWFKVKLNISSLQETSSRLRQLLSTLNIQVNCFPVLNRKLLRKEFKLGDDFNLFPLHPKEYGHFLQIEEVMNSNDQHKYNEKLLSRLLVEDTSGSQPKAKSFAIRYSGISRFNERNLSEMLSDIIYRIREEVFVFNALGKNVVSNNIKLIKKAINDIETKLRTSVEKDLSNIPFIVFPTGDGEYVIVQYWTTQGQVANKIPIGAILKLESSTSWIADSIQLMTSCLGGRKPVDDDDLLQAYKSQLVVRDRIVTEQDIKIYCQKMFGEHINNIQIKRGFALSSEAKQSFTRTIDVHLQLKKADTAYSEFVKKKLRADLNAKSSMLVPIRVETN